MAILPKSSITELDKWHIENIMYMLKSTINYIKAH